MSKKGEKSTEISPLMNGDLDTKIWRILKDDYDENMKNVGIRLRDRDMTNGETVSVAYVGDEILVMRESADGEEQLEVHRWSRSSPNLTEFDTERWDRISQLVDFVEFGEPEDG